jgi:AraC-like DNA-binding protein
MSFVYEERLSDSTYVETITHGWTACDGSSIRPAENSWHMVVVKYKGNTQLYVVGPLTAAGVVTYEEGGEILWIKFKLGTYMPHLPPGQFRDVETVLPEATSRSFWLNGSAWEFPNHENVDTFVDRLARKELLARDPVVRAVLQGGQEGMPARTVRHRFLQTTGLSHSHIRQVERAQQAAALLRQGLPIPDAAYLAGYFDQPHLTRSLKQWVGYTPAQILRNE